MTGLQLAQVNLARLRFPLDAPQSSKFVAAVDRMNRLAEQSAGVVWRYQTGDAHPSAAEETGDPLMLIDCPSGGRPDTCTPTSTAAGTATTSASRSRSSAVHRSRTCRW